MNCRRCAMLVLMWVGMVGLGAGPATRPTTRATTRPAVAKDDRVRDGLVNGSVRFLVPSAWEIAGRAENGLNVVYRLPESHHQVSVLITQQKEALRDTPAIRQQMSKIILGWDNDDLKKRNVEMIDAPKVEADPMLMMRIHERFRDAEGTYDVVHLYRGLGLNLIGVTAVAHTEDAAEAKPIHDAATKLLLSVTLGPPDPKIVRAAPVKKE